MTVQFLDLNRLHASIADELRTAYEDTVANSAFVGAGAVKGFEAAFAAAHDRVGAVGCASGTDALGLALRAVGVKTGDEVVVPSMTFEASAEAVVHAGATPLVADVDPVTLLLTPECVDAVRTERTAAVMPVHLYGHVVPFAHIDAWAASGLAVIEDAAQAHLGTDEGRVVGAASRAACFSFYPGKNLGALGDGGMIASDHPDLLALVRRWRDHGRVEKYVHADIGWCSRLDGLQAAFLAVKLRHLEQWTLARREFADIYRARLGTGEAPGVSLVPWRAGDVHHLLVVRVPARERDALASALGEGGIETGVHYPIPLSRQPALQEWSRPCPNAERAADEVLSLPMDPLMSEEDVHTVCDAITAWASARAA